jgi:3-dehydroquinate dehydratase-1
MQTKKIQIRGMELGNGIPKLCVPLVAETEEELLGQAQEAMQEKPDCVELRVDWFNQVESPAAVAQLLTRLRQCISDTALLFTFRTRQEGGQRDISVAQYRGLCQLACDSGVVDLVDVEALMQEGLLAELCNYAHSKGVRVVASNHDFSTTPPEEELVRRLQLMEQQGADVPKLAVMPQQERDVLQLLSATLRYREQGGTQPVITMSMGKMGMLTRLSGELFGSALTFVTVGHTSAPGQLPIEEARHILSVLHGQGKPA